MDAVIAKAVETLLAAGWRGVVVAILLALLVAVAKVYGIDVLRFFKPSGPQALDPERDPTLPDSVAVDSNGRPVGVDGTDSGQGG